MFLDTACPNPKLQARLQNYLGFTAFCRPNAARIWCRHEFFQQMLVNSGIRGAEYKSSLQCPTEKPLTLDTCKSRARSYENLNPELPDLRNCSGGWTL